jgi:hypothetical protein
MHYLIQMNKVPQQYYRILKKQLAGCVKRTVHVYQDGSETRCGPGIGGENSASNRKAPPDRMRIPKTA